MMRKTIVSVAMVAAACVVTSTAQAQNPRTTLFASGFTNPLFVTAPPGDNTRLFVVEQRGQPSSTQARIRIINLLTNPPSVLATPFLTVGPVSTSNEQGLLGLAFHPDYANNRSFFIYYTNPSTQIVRYKASLADPNVADTTTATTILSFAQTESNHNGGWIGFGPDGYLYIATGDGGGANDNHPTPCTYGNGQCMSTLLGKILRIAVTDTGTYTVPPTNPFTGLAAPFNTIWASGMRNPYRCSFDRTTGEFWMGDVGQGAIEEVSYQPADVNGSMGGRNYGWRCYEGNNPFNTGNCGPANQGSMIFPVSTYGHTLGRNCIIGGYVYRGTQIPSIQGHYFYADNGTSGNLNQIYSFQYTGANNPPVTDRSSQLTPVTGGTIGSITSFGEDASGEMYIVARNGSIFKVIAPAPLNDTCVNATTIGAGNTAFNTAGATTDGPDETGCGFGAPTQIGNDIWYKFVAGCTGTATVSVCGSSFDTRLAAYGACPTAPGQMLACNDNFCGSSSQLSFPVNAGTIYRVRIGGVNSATGTGTLVLSCTTPPPPCAPDITGDNQVNVNDLLAVINAWGACKNPKNCPPDVTGDGQVNVNDLLAVINAWGPCPQ